MISSFKKKEKSGSGIGIIKKYGFLSIPLVLLSVLLLQLIWPNHITLAIVNVMIGLEILFILGLSSKLINGSVGDKKIGKIIYFVIWILFFVVLLSSYLLY
ncbi:hypothetical protein DFP96_1353 [Listeria rocourtiae]|uniref:Uncharacterized protein n=1 Tax=Listeria rocourtiae TaxID=647910 RepID=A0A4R6ZDG2_9LIST|nr:hypothetical protein PROCOU_17675 [Listeria rocourtiae FSL F6-920]TDR50167.1 hypothetical protein DFP96_1353 [Listeria rocourtiae]